AVGVRGRRARQRQTTAGAVPGRSGTTAPRPRSLPEPVPTRRVSGLRDPARARKASTGHDQQARRGRSPLGRSRAGTVRTARGHGGNDTMSTWELWWWVILPYLALATFVVGHVWRWQHDKFGWTSRSTQLQERRLLKWGAPLFHYATFAAIFGHV